MGRTASNPRSAEVGKHALPQDRGPRKHVEGEAVVVDLGQRGLLVAMLRDRSGQGWPAFVLHSLLRPPASPMGETDRQHFDRVLALRGLHDLPRVTGTGATRMDNYPVLLRFPADGATVGAAPVDANALAAAFGPGVALTRITIEPTDAPITRRIRKRLTWLSDDEKRVGAKFRANPALRISASARWISIGTFELGCVIGMSDPRYDGTWRFPPDLHGGVTNGTRVVVKRRVLRHRSSQR